MTASSSEKQNGDEKSAKTVKLELETTSPPNDDEDEDDEDDEDEEDDDGDDDGAAKQEEAASAAALSAMNEDGDDDDEEDDDDEDEEDETPSSNHPNGGPPHTHPPQHQVPIQPYYPHYGYHYPSMGHPGYPVPGPPGHPGGPTPQPPGGDFGMGAMIGHSLYADASSMIDPAPDTRRNRGGVTEPFPEKLHRMLDNAEREGMTDVVSFFSHGRAFAIHKPRRFVTEIMPRFFRQTRLTSFQRQLNLYGFRRISQGPDNGGYYHELFLKGRPGLCVNMKRTKVKGTSKLKRDPDSEPNFYAMRPVVAGSASSSIPSPANTLAPAAPGYHPSYPPPPPPYGYPGYQFPNAPPYTAAQNGNPPMYAATAYPPYYGYPGGGWGGPPPPPPGAYPQPPQQQQQQQQQQPTLKDANSTRDGTSAEGDMEGTPPATAKTEAV